MFKKVEFKLNDSVDVERLKGKYYISYGRFPNPVITYYLIKDLKYLNSLLPDYMPWQSISPFSVKFVELVCDSPGHLLPHVDHDISACANFYINTNNSTTHFYQLKKGQEGFVYPGKTTKNIFHFDQVEKIAGFTAENNNLFFLDVSKIHSVETQQPGKRQFISWQWKNTSFEEICDSLIE